MKKSKVVVIGAGDLGKSTLTHLAKMSEAAVIVNSFENEPIRIFSQPPILNLIQLYDKKGRLLDEPKSKYHN